VIAYEKGKGPRPDALFVAAGVRKGMLMKALEGNMTASEKNYTECGCKAIRDGAKLASQWLGVPLGQWRQWHSQAYSRRTILFTKQTLSCGC